MKWRKTAFTQTISALGFWDAVSAPYFAPSPYYAQREDLSKIQYWSCGRPKWQWSCAPDYAHLPCAPCVGVGLDQAARSFSPEHCRVRAFRDRFLLWPAIRLYTAISLDASRNGVRFPLLPFITCEMGTVGSRGALWAPSFSKRPLVCHPQPLSFSLFNPSPPQPGLELKWKEIPMSYLPLSRCLSHCSCLFVKRSMRVIPRNCLHSLISKVCFKWCCPAAVALQYLLNISSFASHGLHLQILLFQCIPNIPLRQAIKSCRGMPLDGG